MPAWTGGAALALASGAISAAVANVNVRSRMCPSLRMLMNKFSGADRMEAPCRKHGASPKKMALWKEAIKTSRGSRVVRRDTIFCRAFVAQKEKGRPASGCETALCAKCSYLRLPQKRWMRLQASSRSEVLVAYEIRNAGPSPNAEPCTTATPSFSKSSVTKSSSLAMTLPDGEVLPMVPAQDG